MLRKKYSFLFIVVLLIFFLAACGSDVETGENPPQAPTENGQESSTNNNNEPAENSEQAEAEDVTLNIFVPQTSVELESLMEQYGRPIQDAYPHITVEFSKPPSTNVQEHISTLIASDQLPDIILSADYNYTRFIKPFGLEYDISELISKHQYDLAQIEESAVVAARNLSGGEGLAGLPYQRATIGLLYNIDLFEQFAQDQPFDGMTWDETYTLAQAMTRFENDTQYKGFITQSFDMAWLNQLSVGHVDPETDETVFLSDERWSDVVNNWVRFYEIAGNEFTETSFSRVKNSFYGAQVAAMYAYYFPTDEQEVNGVNWDIVRLPEFADRPGVGPQFRMDLAFIMSTSEHKDDAFKAITVLTEDPFQRELSESGRGLPVSSNQEIKDIFGQGNPVLEGKNVGTLLEIEPAENFPITPYSWDANALFESKMYELGRGEMDVNTFLRAVGEEVTSRIEEIKASEE